jgi:polysaccharide transporter, PST family
MNLLRNFTSLSSLHGASLLLPLLIYPYLSRVFGPEAFGELIVSQAIIQYFILLVDFGFNLSAARDVALAAGNRNELLKIFWSVFWAKALLAALSGLCVAAYYLLSSCSTLASLVLIQYLGVIGVWLFPFWLMQGLERFVSASILSVISKAAALPLIFLFVQHESDLYYAALSFGFSGLVLASFGVFEISRLIGFSKRPRVSWSDVKRRLREGWPLFLSSVGVSLYSATNLILLRLVASPAEVGYFAAAEKLRAAAIGLIPVMTNVIYPSSARNQGRVNSLRSEVLARYPILALGALVCLVMLFSAPFAIELLFGAAMAPAIVVLRIMAFSALVIPFSHIIGIHVFVARGQSKYFSHTLIGAGLINVALLPFLGAAFQAPGAAYSLLTTELVVALSLTLLFYRIPKN